MAASENTSMLEVKNLGISFGGLRAVDNFNMTIEKGQFLDNMKIRFLSSGNIGVSKPPGNTCNGYPGK